jgi:hypothetical protein
MAAMTPRKLTPPPPVPLAEAAHFVAMTRARKAVDEAASAAALLGVVFAVLGAILMIPVVGGRMRGGLRPLAAADALILVGPGVWYFLAASLIRRLDRRAVVVGLRVAAVQGTLVAAGLLLAALLRRRDAEELTVPAIVAMFFMPALAALAHHLWRARQAINLLGGGETGFEALAPRPAIPLILASPRAEDSGAAGADDSGQGSDSFLAK